MDNIYLKKKPVGAKILLLEFGKGVAHKPMVQY